MAEEITKIDTQSEKRNTSDKLILAVSIILALAFIGLLIATGAGAFAATPAIQTAMWAIGAIGLTGSVVAAGVTRNLDPDEEKNKRDLEESTSNYKQKIRENYKELVNGLDIDEKDKSVLMTKVMGLITEAKFNSDVGNFESEFAKIKSPVTIGEKNGQAVKKNMNLNEYIDYFISQVKKRDDTKIDDEIEMESSLYSDESKNKKRSTKASLKDKQEEIII